MKGNDKIYLSIIGGLLLVVLSMVGGAIKWYVATTGESNNKQWEYIRGSEVRVNSVDKRVVALETKSGGCK